MPGKLVKKKIALFTKFLEGDENGNNEDVFCFIGSFSSIFTDLYYYWRTNLSKNTNEKDG